MESILKAEVNPRPKASASQSGSLAAAEPMQYNVAAIARLEQESLLKRSTAERISDTITRFTGSMMFVLFHVALFAFWFAVNLNLIPQIPAFDPFPFGVLTLIVSTEGVFLAIFILISQNRATRQADRRAHLDLQVNMLAEQELTMMLRMQQLLCEHFGVKVESIRKEAHELLKETDVERLVSEIEEKLPV